MRAESLVRCGREHRLLDLVDVLLRATRPPPRSGRRPVAHGVDDGRGAVREDVAHPLEPVARLAQAAARAVPDGDDELVADEQADLAGLDGVLLVDVPEGLEHDEQRVGVALDLGALVGADRVLDGQRVQVVEVGDGLELVAGRGRAGRPRRSRRPRSPWRARRPGRGCRGRRSTRSPLRYSALSTITGSRLRPLTRTLRGMATVILARHGRTAANTGGVLAGRSKGVHLDETGIAQAEAAARAAGRASPLAAVVTSPLERCRETAKLLAPGSSSRRGPAPARVRLRRVDRSGAQDAGQGEALAHGAGPALRCAVSRAASRCRRCRRGPSRRSATGTRTSRPRPGTTPCGWRSPTAT